MFLVDDLDYSIGPAHTQQVVISALRQAQRPLVVFLHVHRHVTHTLVLPQVPEAQIAIVATGDQFEALGAEQDGGD